MARTFCKTWWGNAWLQALSHIDYSNRIPRGARYARNGSVKSVVFDDNKIKAKVLGSRMRPYTVTMVINKFSESEKERLIDIPQIKKSPQTNTVPIFSVSLPRISCTSAIKASFIALGLHYPCRTNINPINKSRKLMTHWSILTFVMTFAFCHNVQGQVNYTYNG